MMLSARLIFFFNHKDYLEAKNMRCFCLYKGCKWGGAIFTACVTKDMLEKK